MSKVGEQAPQFARPDHFGRLVRLEDFRHISHVLLLFYPFDWTPAASRELPAVELLIEAFRAARTQVLGVSVDSVHSHAHWAGRLGGISFPLLSDFEPKGWLGRLYGHYLEEQGVDDCATVLIDASGVVQWSHSLGPQGERDLRHLLRRCENLDRKFDSIEGPTSGAALAAGSELFVERDSALSWNALLARQNLHLEGHLPVVDIAKFWQQRKRLDRATGTDQAPCLKLGAEIIHDAELIAVRLAQRVAPIPGGALASAGTD